MSDLEVAMATIIAVFRKYSEREGDPHKLKKSELKELVMNDLKSFQAGVKDEASLNSLMEGLDASGDGECDFQEFMTYLAAIAVCCHELLCTQG